MLKINLVAFLKRIYGRKIHSKFLDPTLFSFKEINLCRDVSRLSFFSLRKIEPFFSEPVIFIYQNSLSGRKWLNATGKSFFSKKDALLATIGETIERFSWNNYSPSIKITDSISNLKGKAINLSELSGFSEEQKEKNNDLQYNASSEFQWIEASELVFQTKKLCPAQLFSPSFFNKFVKDKKKEPILRVPVSTGVAAGWSRNEILYRGILESIERDAFMITYLNKITPYKIDLRSAKLSIHNINIHSYFEGFNLEVYSVFLISDLPPYSIMSFIIDKSGEGPALSVGAKADFNIESAILGSLGEAITVRLFSKAGGLSEKSVANDFDSFGQYDRKIYWSKRENLSGFEFMMCGELKSLSDLRETEIELKNKESLEVKIEYLISALRHKKYTCIYVDITPKNALFNLRSGVTLIPQLQPMHLDEKFAYYGGGRLKTVPKDLGYRVVGINTIPHPFH